MNDLAQKLMEQQFAEGKAPDMHDVKRVAQILDDILSHAIFTQVWMSKIDLKEEQYRRIMLEACVWMGHAWSTKMTEDWREFCSQAVLFVMERTRQIAT